MKLDRNMPSEKKDVSTKKVKAKVKVKRQRGMS